MTAATDVAPVVITEPGVYADLSPEDYHRDPVAGGSLSCSGAKKLLPPSAPAVFKYERDNPPPPRDLLDFGSAAHRVILGAGADLVVVEADDWRTNAAKEQKKAAHAAGLIPLLRKDYAVVEVMAAQLRAHSTAAKLLSTGTAETAMVWRDDETGVWCRSLLDILPATSPSGRMIIPDYKTAPSAHPDKFVKQIVDYSYHQQAAFYMDGALTLGLAEDVAFVFVVQEKDPPYLVSVVELDATALVIGRIRNRQAIDIYAECVATDTWPSYTSGVTRVSLPTYIERQYEEQL